MVKARTAALLAQLAEDTRGAAPHHAGTGGGPAPAAAGGRGELRREARRGARATGLQRSVQLTHACACLCAVPDVCGRGSGRGRGPQAEIVIEEELSSDDDRRAPKGGKADPRTAVAVAPAAVHPGMRSRGG